MSDTPLLQIKNGRKRYGSHVALSVEDVEIVSGDRTIVSGENGSGKSTLLRIVAGLTDLDAGTLQRSAHCRGLSIGYLPQEGGIYRDLTLSENQRVFRSLLGSPIDPARAEVLAHRLDLSGVFHKRVGDLSGGFRRLAAIHGLLSAGADALVLDEPFASLDLAKILAVGEALRGVMSEYAFMLVSEHSESTPQIKAVALWSKELTLERPKPYVSAEA